MSVNLSSVLAAVRSNEAKMVIERVASVLMEMAGTTKSSWVMLHFGKSARTPQVHSWSYRVENEMQEQILQRGPFSLANALPTEATFLKESELKGLAAGTLDMLFPTGAFYLPVWTPFGVDLEGRAAAGLVLGFSTIPNRDDVAIAACQLALSIAVGVSIQKEVDNRLHDADLLGLIEGVELAHSRRKACQTVLDKLNSLVPYEAGVLYLLDQDPGRNEYLLFGASRNESPDELFKSYYSREDLGFTWEVAKARIPRAGSVADVPPSARGANDSALAHVTKRHDAWMVVPFTARDNTRAVAHLEGVRNCIGASLADLELARRLGELVGRSLDRRLRSLPVGRGEPSMVTLETMRSIARGVVPNKSASLEGFVRSLFGDLEGLTTVAIQSRTIPQIDALFLLTASDRRFVVEVKGKDNHEKSLGVEVIEQLTGQMTAIGSSHGFLVTTAKFGSRVADSTLGRHLVTVLDGDRLERFCVHSRDERRELLLRWLARNSPGAKLASFS